MPDFLQPLASPLSFGLVALGAFLGITVGAIPGLTGAMLIALTLPLTFSMEPATGSEQKGPVLEETAGANLEDPKTRTRARTDPLIILNAGTIKFIYSAGLLYFVINSL